jgi:hypothetical protein
MAEKQMRRRGFSIWMILILAAGMTCLHGVSVRADGPRVFVQTIKTPLRAEPKMESAEVKSLQRGDELAVVKVQGMWLQVQFKGTTGWISKIFTSTHKPVGQAALMKDVKEDLSKTSRRRSSSYDVSASTRGLTGNSRAREGKDMYKADYDSLEKKEKSQPSEKQLNEFEKEGEGADTASPAK